MRQILLVFSMLVLTGSYAQKMKVKEGSLGKLKGITEYNLVFDYSELKIPKYDSEEDFLKDKMEKRENKKAGDGERFKKSWFADREERYEPKFIESFNKRFKNNEVKVDKNLSSSKYTMKIHTTKIYPGYNVGIVRHNSEIDATVCIYESANPSNILLKGTFKDVQGAGAMGYDFNSGYRISECYAKLAKTIAKYVKKQN